MHYAERVTLRVGTGAPVELVSDIEAGTLAPIVQQAHDLDGAFLVLGWASWGGGAQTNSALIVDARGCDGLRLADLRALPATRADAAAWFAPPGGAGMQRPPSSVAAVWFAATVDGFHAPSH